MKRQNLTAQHVAHISRTMIAASTVIAAIFFAGCSQTPIFATIEGEAALNDPTIRNHVYAFVVANPSGAASKDIFLTNGFIYKRTAGTGSWAKIDLPSSDVRCSFLATDKLDGTGSLYGLFVSTTDWSSFNSVQKYDGSSWTTVAGLSTISRIGSGYERIYAFVDDETQSGTSSESTYNVFVTPSAGAVTFNTTAIVSNILTPVGSAGNFFATRAYDGGSYTSQIYSYDGTTLTKLTTGLPTTNVRSIACDVNNNAYILASDTVYQTTATAFVGSYTHTITTPANYVSIIDTSDTDYIFVSGEDGYCEIPGQVGGSWNSSSQTPGSSTTSSILTVSKAQYTSSLGQYRVLGFWGVADPVPSSKSYVLYAAIADADYDGLWAYYRPTSYASGDTVPNWNRE